MTNFGAASAHDDAAPSASAVPAQAEFLSVAEAANLLGVSERTVRRAIERGDLEAVKAGRSLKLPLAALAARRQPAALARARPHLRLVEYAPDDVYDAGSGWATALEPAGPLVRLPTSLTGFVGRAGEVDAVTTLLRREDVRLVTLLGVGGVGKTRLAMRAADEVAASFRDGAAFVPLASVHDPSLVPTTIVQSLGLRPVVNQPPLARLQTVLRSRQMLLVLDNFEHLMPAGPVVVELLAACEELTILVTSRVRLRVSGERTFSVQPLSVPGPVRAGFAERPLSIAELSRVESVQLFVERAQAARADFALTPEQAPAIAAICTRLDGLPLAIELAAARCAVLTPASMLTRLDQRLPLLTGGPRDQPDRLRTMRDAITWSYDLLSPVEQALFRHVSVFAGGFTFDAAEAMLRQPTDRPGRPHPKGVPGTALAPAANGAELALTTIEGLVGQSLVVPLQPAEPAPVTAHAADPRFTMLETIREFGQEKLEASGEAQTVRAAHAAYLLALVEAEDPAPPAEQTEWRHRIEAERDNLRAALAWVIDQRDADAALRIAAALGPVWRSRGPYAEGRQWLERALALDGGPDQARLAAMIAFAQLLSLQGEFARLLIVGESVLVLARQLDDRSSIAQGLMAVGEAVDNTGTVTDAIPYYEEALALFHAVGDGAGAAETLGHLSNAAWKQGDVALFAARAEEALAIWRRLGKPSGVIQSLDRLSLAARVEGRLSEQASLASEIVALTRTVEDPMIIASTLWTAAAIASERGQTTLSARLFGAEEALREATGFILDPAFADGYVTTVNEIRGRLGEARFASIWAAGRALAPAQALTEAKTALELLAAATTSAADVTAAAAYGLTPREREVLRLVVNGYSDKEIAAALFVSRSTASKHVSAILDKLGAESRTAATALAYRDGLL